MHFRVFPYSQGTESMGDIFGGLVKFKTFFGVLEILDTFLG